MKDFEKKMKAYALKNAISHEGKANQGAVISGMFNEGLKKEDIKKYSKKINKIIEEVNKLSSEEQKREFSKIEGLVGKRPEREGLPEIPNTENGIITRFAPSPSGPLHIGHVISNMISSMYVRKYGGKFYIRIEDTNPESIFPGAYENIKKDCDWIFGNVTEYIVQSDRMEIYYKYIEKLIDKNSAYVCSCSQEKFKAFSEKKKDCPCRNLKDQKERWNEMLSKIGYKPGQAVVRFKSGMTNPNPAMRDFPLARISEKEHLRQGKKYRVWPLMNLSVTVDDIEFGMTHIIRGKDHRDNALRQKMIYESLELDKKYPWTFFMGRIKFTDLAISKRKMVAAIKSGEFTGIDDVNLPTIASLKKRGYKPEAFEKFAEQRGLTEVDKVMSKEDFFKIIDNFNKNY